MAVAYICPRCGAELKNVSEYVEHLRRVHGE
jgi:uncharacterized C2H2 Zn-finger protein